MRRGLSVAALLLLAGWACAQDGHFDQRIGKVAFHIVKSGGKEMVVEPLLPVTLQTMRISGEENPSTGVVQCDVFKTALILDEKVMWTTKMKCSGAIYTVQEIDFVKAE